MTRASAARRERRLFRKTGRPEGSYASLLLDARRFAIAVWWAFRDPLGPYAAARLAVVLIDERTRIGIEDIDGLILSLNANYAPVAPSDDLDGRAKELVRKAELMTKRASEREIAWLTQSTGAIQGYVRFAATGDVGGLKLALGLLDHAGWRVIVSRLARRLDTALKSNMPPRDGPLSAAARRLLGKLRAENANSNQDMRG
jgi:hypothetical protein